MSEDDEVRGYWARPDGLGASLWDEDGVECTFSEHGLLIAVTEEKAVDSYNKLFTCDVMLSLDDARSLADWLNDLLARAGR